MLIKKYLITAKTGEEIKVQVISQLRDGGCCIVDSADEARESLAYNSEEDKNDVDIEEENVANFNMEIEKEDEEHGYYTETFKVVVTAYYQDPGSNDYFYRVKVTEL